MSSQAEKIKNLIKSEIYKCKLDPTYFLNKYCFIKHTTRGKIPFALYPFQVKTLKDFHNNRYNIILKSRQLGISTLTGGYTLWLMLFHENKECVIVATTQNVAKNLVGKIRYMYDNLPSWIRSYASGSDEKNKMSISFGNGSSVKAISSTSIRSEALALLVIDEAAFIYDADELWVAAQQTLATGGKAIMLSTPNGVGNLFHKKWLGAVEGHKGNEFNPIRLDWKVHPERDQKWRDEQDILLGPKMATQECDANFVTSGYSVVDGEIIQFYNDTYVQEPVEKRGFDQGYWIWEAPDYSKQYMVVSDVARGDGTDYSTFHVIDIERLVQVAEYRGQMPTKEFGNMLVNVATEYNEALLVIENANIGWAAIQPAIDRNYKNLFYMAKDLKYFDIQSQLSKGYDLKNTEQMVPGFSTNEKTRPLIISKLETLFREKLPIIRSERLTNELFVFVWENGRAKARRGYNDDLVMAFAIGLWVRDTAFKLIERGIQLTKSSIDYIYKPIATPKTNNLAINPWNMRIGGKDEDISWLIKK